MVLTFGGDLALKRFTIQLAAFIVVSTILTGCAVNRATATIDPSANLASIKRVHVTRKSNDRREIDLKIADEFRSRGFFVTTEPEKSTSADAVVTYVDSWMWDITMYMVQLTIIIRDPKTDYQLASGNSHHSSLSRKSPKEMVSEVIGNIFKEQKN